MSKPSSEPRYARIAAYAALCAGLVFIGFGLRSFAATPPSPLPSSLALLVSGALSAGLAWLVLQGRRAGWAFLLSLYIPGALVFLFGVARVRDGFEVPLGVAALPALFMIVVCVLLAIDHRRF